MVSYYNEIAISLCYIYIYVHIHIHKYACLSLICVLQSFLIILWIISNVFWYVPIEKDGEDFIVEYKQVRDRISEFMLFILLFMWVDESLILLIRILTVRSENMPFQDIIHFFYGNLVVSTTSNGRQDKRAKGASS